jgi:predicted DNA-binding protein with PD1-like motif
MARIEQEQEREREMKSKLLNERPRTFALIFDKGDAVNHILLEFAAENDLKASHFTAIGSFSEATLGFFERERKDYKHIEIKEQVEVMSLIGNIVRSPDGEHKLHAHVVIGKPDGSAHGGHLLNGTVWPTLELFLTETSGELRRKLDDETNLPLIAIE